MLFIDSAIRFGGLFAILALAALCLKPSRTRKARLARRLLGFTALSLSGPLLLGAPPQTEPPEWIEAVASVLAAPNAVLLWLFGLALFDDEFEIRPWHWGVSVFATLLGLSHRFADLHASLPAPEARMTLSILAAGLLGLHIFYRIITEARDDLVQGRRRARIYIVITLALGSLASLSSEYLLPPAGKDLFQATGTTVFATIALAWLTRFDPARLRFQPARATPAEPGEDLERLLDLMTEEKLYLQPGLSLSGFARRAGLPDYKARAILNGQAGYRNFSHFVNSYRVAAAQDRLLRAEDAATPILTIALECGFNSLAPFNRAFLAITGVTPSAYRQKNVRDS